MRAYLEQVFWLIDYFGSPAIEKDVLAAYVPEQAKEPQHAGRHGKRRQRDIEVFSVTLRL